VPFGTINRLPLIGISFLLSFQIVATPTFPGKNVPQESGSVRKGYVAGAIQMLSDTQGVDFNYYLRDVYLSVKKRWFSRMPASVAEGEKGTNTLEFHILQDGTIPKESVKMVLSSGKSDFDASSFQAIREAAPFSHLPEKFPQPFIVLRFTFYYNLPGPQNPK
jgi:TonB family protein